MKIKRYILSALILAPIFAFSQTETALTYTFDFADPVSLTPSIPEPAVKEGVSLRDITLENGPISVTFQENPSSNTHVRIYHSYDAGCDLRIYDGEQMIVSVAGDYYYLESISFDMSFSGTTSDVDFSPSSGRYEWTENTWYSDSDDVTSVVLTSILQSRTTKMTVTLNTSTGIESVVEDDNDAIYFDMTGRRVFGIPSAPGIYIRNGKKIYI